MHPAHDHTLVRSASAMLLAPPPLRLFVQPLTFWKFPFSRMSSTLSQKKQ
jgi:hypothetical protein